MDKNRVDGAGHEIKGAAKEALGKVTGNTGKQPSFGPGRKDRRHGPAQGRRSRRQGPLGSPALARQTKPS